MNRCQVLELPSPKIEDFEKIDSLRIVQLVQTLRKLKNSIRYALKNIDDAILMLSTLEQDNSKKHGASNSPKPPKFQVASKRAATSRKYQQKISLGQEKRKTTAVQQHGSGSLGGSGSSNIVKDVEEKLSDNFKQLLLDYVRVRNNPRKHSVKN